MLRELLKGCSRRGVHLSYDDLGSGDVCRVARNDLTRADILMRDRSAFSTTWAQPWPRPPAQALRL